MGVWGLGCTFGEQRSRGHGTILDTRWSHLRTKKNKADNPTDQMVQLDDIFSVRVVSRNIVAVFTLLLRPNEFPWAQLRTSFVVGGTLKLRTVRHNPPHHLRLCYMFVARKQVDERLPQLRWECQVLLAEPGLFHSAQHTFTCSPDFPLQVES